MLILQIKLTLMETSDILAFLLIEIFQQFPISKKFFLSFLYKLGSILFFLNLPCLLKIEKLSDPQQ